MFYGEKEIYKNACLETRELNYHDDSDFYFIAWDEERQEIVSAIYDSTRYAGGPYSYVHADATQEVKEKAKAYIKKQLLESFHANNKIQSSYIRIGREVKIVKGRKYPLGIKGTVLSLHESQFGGRTVHSAKIRTKEFGEIYVNTLNLKTFNPKRYLKSEDEARQIIEFTVNRQVDQFNTYTLNCVHVDTDGIVPFSKSPSNRCFVA